MKVRERGHVGLDGRGAALHGGINAPGPAHESIWRCGWEAETLARTILVGDLNESPDDRSG
jgi:hypothetical protein